MRRIEIVEKNLRISVADRCLFPRQAEPERHYRALRELGVAAASPFRASGARPDPLPTEETNTHEHLDQILARSS